MLAMVVAAVLVIGCGKGGSTETAEKRPQPDPESRLVEITLDGYPSVENVGIFMAKKRGYFADVGIKVAPTTPVTPLNVIGYVTQGAVDLGISHQPQVVMAKEKGASIIAIGSLVEQPTMAMIWLKKSGIDGIADLKGKTVAIVGFPFEVDFLQSVLARAGLTLDDVKLERVSYELVADLASGRADAIFGGSWNVEGAELEARGLEPVITRVQDLGIPPYDELAVIGRPDRLSRDSSAIRDFMSAVARGTAAAIEDPEAAAKTIAAARARFEYSNAPPPKLMQGAVKAALPLLSKTGHMNPAQADHLVDWMVEEGLIQRALPASALLTNQFVEPQ
jgi:putative hydroxymethylpyrimidine transport system substrate-binding protein